MKSLLAACTVSLHLALATVQAAGSGKPNLVIILADDLGYGDLSGYGNTKYQTPHLDRMAAEGAKLTHFNWARPSTTCSPALFLTRSRRSATRLT